MVVVGKLKILSNKKYPERNTLQRKAGTGSNWRLLERNWIRTGKRRNW